MDYEKAYLEALDRAKAGKSMNEVFPELKESEDERIRKEIIVAIGHYLCASDLKNKCLAYLEKQKAQKPAKDTVLQKAFINSKIDYTLEEKCDASDYAEVILPTSAIYGESEEEYKLHKIIEAAFIAGKKIAQKPAEWSEKDEAMLKVAIAVLRRYSHDDVANWLKSLRLQPQWKPSKEQMEALYNAQRELCGTKYNEGLCSLIDYLKKL